MEGGRVREGMEGRREGWVKLAWGLRGGGLQWGAEPFCISYQPLLFLLLFIPFPSRPIHSLPITSLPIPSYHISCSPCSFSSSSFSLPFLSLPFLFLPTLRLHSAPWVHIWVRYLSGCSCCVVDKEKG